MDMVYSNCKYNGANLNSMQITDFKFEFIDDKFNVTVILQRPGLLIGKGGRIIDALRKYLNDLCNVDQLTIEESNIWKRVK